MVGRRFGGVHSRHKALEIERRIRRQERTRKREQAKNNIRVLAIKRVAKEILREELEKFGRTNFQPQSGRAANTKLYLAAIDYYSRIIALDGMAYIHSGEHLISKKRLKEFNDFVNSIPDVERVKHIITSTEDRFEQELIRKRLYHPKQKLS